MPGAKFLGTFQIGAGQYSRCPGIGGVGRECVSYLFQNANRFLDRDDIIDKFWERDDRSDGKSALNSTTSRLRRALTAPGLPNIEMLSDKWSLGIFMDTPDASDTAILADIYRQLKAGQGDVREHYRKLVAIYNGEFIPGHVNRWTIFERERLLGLFVRSCLLIVDQLIQEGEYSHAAEGCRIILVHDPLRESVHRRLLLLHALRGEGQKIRQHFERFENFVWAECHAKPTRRTRSLYDALCTDPSEHALDGFFQAEISAR